MVNYVVHRRKTSNDNGTLCSQEGFKTFLSNRVTCSQCLQLMEVERLVR